MFNSECAQTIGYSPEPCQGIFCMVRKQLSREMKANKFETLWERLEYLKLFPEEHDKDLAARLGISASQISDLRHKPKYMGSIQLMQQIARHVTKDVYHWITLGEGPPPCRPSEAFRTRGGGGGSESSEE